ncbi:TonB-dependent receptor [Puteibacter caeruleilacunae]|nr:TonB-dependent receptor [Puteibacter caeruleilacunae]
MMRLNLFYQNQIFMKKCKLSVLMMVMFFWAGVVSSFAQDNIISGTVVDEANEPIPGVSIVFKGTTRGTVTDFDGKYNIEKVDDSATLVFSFVGMSSQEIDVTGKSKIDVVMKVDAIGLDEIVAVGYGVQKKSDVTGAVTTINTDRMDSKPNVNFAQALQGALTGVYVNTSSSSAEGGSTSLLLRGRNSINASNDPLIILDGVPFSGGISDINTVDIKSINVLKDASSTAIYGSRGANGVILIETKKGELGKPTISYNGYYGVSEIAKMLDMYDGPGYAAWKMERYGIDKLDNSEQAILDAGEWMDWQEEITQAGVKQEHNLSIRGGGEKVKYFVSGTFFDSKGIAINDEFSRYNLRFNMDMKIFDWMSYATSNQMTYIDRSGLPVNVGRGYSLNPLTSKYDEKGNYTIYPWPEDIYFSNPFEPTLADNDDTSYRVITNNSFNIQLPFIPGLSYKLNTGVEFGYREIGTYWGRNTLTGKEKNGVSETENKSERNYLVENIISYVRSFGKHDINFTGLYSYQYERYKKFMVESSNFPNDVLTYYQPNLAASSLATVDYNGKALLSQMGRLNYGYDNRYMVTLTVRRDGYTGFGDNKKYGVFPSMALGWNVHNEEFFNSELFSSLKARFSYGKNGNQAVGPYDNLARLGVDNYIVGSKTMPGFVPANLANANLSWETTTTANFGFDFSMLTGRFQGTFDIYQSRTKDLLFKRKIPSVHGITSIIQNIGETKNEGIELSLKGHVIDQKDFKWNAGVNFSTNRNEIVSLYGAKEDDVAAKLFIGQPIRVNYGYVFDGIWQENDDIDNSAQPLAVAGDVKIKDITNDEDGKSIGSEDRQIQGQRDPKWTWGMENTFSYKNWSLYVFLHGVQGVTKNNNSKLNESDSFDGRVNTNIKNYWTPENPINTYPRNHRNANVFGASIYEVADFMRVKDVTLSYNLDSKLVKKWKIDNMKMFVTGRNLLTVTDWDGMDPEIDSQLSIPLQREYVFGVQFSF